MSSKKCKSSCSFANAKKAPQQEQKLLAMDEEDILHSLSITSLVLLPSFVVLGFLKSKIRKRSENYFLTNLGAGVVELRLCKGYFPPKATFEPAL